MAPVLGSWVIILSTLFLGAIGFAYLYLSYKHSHWKRKGVPYLEPRMPFGNMTDSFLQRINPCIDLKLLYDSLKSYKFAGIYFIQHPILLAIDPEFIKTMMVKDFSYFEDHIPFTSEDVDPLQTKNLFSLTGKRWRHMRVKLTPTFTSGKMKKMFHLVCQCGEQLQKYFEVPATEGQILEVKDVMGKYTTDVIGSCAFGIQINSLKNPDSEFRKMGKKFMDPPGLLRTIMLTTMFIFPGLSKLLRISFTPSDVADFFRETVRDTMEHREKTNMVRNDFVDLLLQLKKKGKVENDEPDAEVENNNLEEDSMQELTHDDLTAQAMIFFLGGFETSSTLMAFLLYELAINPEVQTRLQEEIDATLEANDGKFTYQAVMHDMKYLDKVVSESLRKYPPLPAIGRVCTKDYTIPGTSIKVEKGTWVEIPTFGLHYDPQYYPDPEKFDPERFNEENKRMRPNCTYLPFGEGPRICIGQRFGFMQSKVGLVHLLSKYSVKRCPKTTVPAEIDPTTFMLAPKGGIWVQMAKRKLN